MNEFFFAALSFGLAAGLKPGPIFLPILFEFAMFAEPPLTFAA